ncbi:hypothetical protein Ddc_06785 [Ditylenchus destructor]|nr:hypothetical protein Ddc_06785 [Ditylenchus destructor]
MRPISRNRPTPAPHPRVISLVNPNADFVAFSFLHTSQFITAVVLFALSHIFLLKQILRGNATEPSGVASNLRGLALPKCGLRSLSDKTIRSLKRTSRRPLRRTWKYYY